MSIQGAKVNSDLSLQHQSHHGLVSSAHLNASTETRIAQQSTSGASIHASYYAGPAARKLARELAVDLNDLSGQGKGGRVLKEDIKAYVKQRMSQDSQRLSGDNEKGVPALPVEDFSRYGAIRPQAMTQLEKVTAAHMTRCWLNIPHVTIQDSVDISVLEQFRSQIEPAHYGLARKPALLPFIIMAVAKALRAYPRFNRALDVKGEQIIFKEYINIGIAVDTPTGLVVPVIKDVDKKSISELTKDINHLAEKAKARKISAEDIQGGCFTISSLGVTGGTGFTPIVNGPEVAILGVAKAEIKPVWDGIQFQPKKHLPLCLSFDHRVINGADAGKFLALLHQSIYQVARLLL